MDFEFKRSSKSGLYFIYEKAAKNSLLENYLGWLTLLFYSLITIVFFIILLSCAILNEVIVNLYSRLKLNFMIEKINHFFLISLLCLWFTMIPPHHDWNIPCISLLSPFILLIKEVDDSTYEIICQWDFAILYKWMIIQTHAIRRHQNLTTILVATLIRLLYNSNALTTSIVNSCQWHFVSLIHLSQW